MAEVTKSEAGGATGEPESSGLSWLDERQILERLGDYAIFVIDAAGSVVTWNGAAHNLTGYTADQIMGRDFASFYPREDAEAGKPAHALAVAEQLGRLEDEGFRLKKDGSTFWANVVITALRDDNGTLRGFALGMRDLTQRRNAELELRAAEERFHHLVDAVTDYAIFILDATGRVATWNIGAQRTKGYRPDEIIGRHFSCFYTDEDRAAGKPERVLETVRSVGRFEEEGFRVRKDGSHFWASVAITALRNDAGELVGFAKVTRDLTERQIAEQTARKLLREQVARAAAEQSESLLRASEETAQRAAKAAQEAAERADEANRVKDEFLATVSHELRTPLNAIMGWAALLRGRGEDPSVRRGIEAIHRNAQAQARIVEDILDVSRIITGKLRLDLKSVDVTATMNEAIEIVRPSADAKDIAIEFVPPREVATLLADPGRLQQVIWNLLSNAVKFTGRNGCVIAEVEQQGSKLVISVRDTGRGISPEFLPYVFDRFKQADSSITRRHGGLGLGLAIVRHIVELHGGRVRAESAGQGQGALFQVTLPVRAVAAPQPEEERVSAPSEPVNLARRERLSLSGLRVLVVDDDDDARGLLEDVLAGAGAEVETAPSAAAGFDAVQRSRPHVLVSDIGMPEEDGYSFVRRVRSLTAPSGISIPSIALTAYTRGIDRTKALAAGFTTHISKPVNPDDLVAAVANLASFVAR